MCFSSRRFQAKQSRSLKIYVPEDDGSFIPGDSRIVVSHVGKHQQEIIFLRDLKKVVLSCSDDRCMNIEYDDSTSDKGGQSLLFLSFADRQLFLHFLRFLNPKIRVESESEWGATRSDGDMDMPVSEEGGPNIVSHRAETVNALGLRTEIVLIFDYSRRTLSLGLASVDSDHLPRAMIDSATIQMHSGSSTRLELTYLETTNSAETMSSSGGGSTGSGVLQKVCVFVCLFSTVYI